MKIGIDRVGRRKIHSQSHPGQIVGQLPVVRGFDQKHAVESRDLRQLRPGDLDFEHPAESGGFPAIGPVRSQAFQSFADRRMGVRERRQPEPGRSGTNGPLQRRAEQRGAQFEIGFERQHGANLGPAGKPAGGFRIRPRQPSVVRHIGDREHAPTLQVLSSERLRKRADGLDQPTAGVGSGSPRFRNGQRPGRSRIDQGVVERKRAGTAQELVESQPGIAQPVRKGRIGFQRSRFGGGSPPIPRSLNRSRQRVAAGTEFRLVGPPSRYRFGERKPPGLAPRRTPVPPQQSAYRQKRQSKNDQAVLAQTFHQSTVPSLRVTG